LSTPAGVLRPTPAPLIPVPRSTPLWYAAVFPQLLEAPPPLPGQAPPSAQPSPMSVLQRLSLHAQQFTSLVSIEPPNALLLEIKGSLRLFGSLGQLHALIDARWKALALQASSAVAPSTLAALWCARGGLSLALEDPAALAARLAQLPIAGTAWDTDRLQTLRSMGITRLGELLRLPRAGLARRLGPSAVLDLDIALARQPGPRRAFVRRQRFREQCEFETEIDSVAYLEKALEPLIGRCARFLCERQAGIQSLELKLRHRTGPATRVQLGLANATSERRRLADVLEQRLSRLELPAPVRALELVSGALQPLSAVSLDAFSGFGNAGGPDTAAQLVERLRARLGEHAVYGVSPVCEHRPEAAWRRVHELQLAATLAAAAPAPPEAMPRPVWLLDEPLLLSRQAALQRGAWILEHGPERIESGWWDGKGVTRDYYCARQTQGAKLWIFQERHTKCWYLHGLFA
jgi:protein ImuB